MPNFCIFSLVRTSCENFIKSFPFSKWHFNSFDLFYNRKQISDILQTVHETPHVCKIYIETYDNDIVRNLVDNLIEKDYIFIHFFRSNIIKHFLTKKLQDNLIGNYGVDYNEFNITKNGLNEFITNNKHHTDKFLKDFREKLVKYDTDIGLTEKMQELDEIVGVKIKFNDAFNLENCKKFIKNFNIIGKDL
jgi:hypothetical protein